MKLYWCPQTRSLRGLWLMEEAGVPYEPVRIDIRNPAEHTNAQFRAASPMGKVPALEDGEVRRADHRVPRFRETALDMAHTGGVRIPQQFADQTVVDPFEPS